MIFRNDDFEDVKIIPASICFFLISILIIYIDEYILHLSNDNLLQLYINITFFLVLLFMFKSSPRKIYYLIEDFLCKFNLKEILMVVATQFCFSYGSILFVIGILCVVNIDIANNLLYGPEDMSTSINTYTDLFIYFFLVVITAPLVEEVFFRSICFKGLTKTFNVIFGMIVSSLVFGLLHIELAIIGAVAFGIANCILYLKYKNIIIPMIVHFINNLISTLPLFKLEDNSSVTLLTQSDTSYFLIAGSLALIVGSILFCIFIIKNAKYIKNNAFDEIGVVSKKSLF